MPPLFVSTERVSSPIWFIGWVTLLYAAVWSCFGEIEWSFSTSTLQESKRQSAERTATTERNTHLTMQCSFTKIMTVQHVNDSDIKNTRISLWIASPLTVLARFGFYLLLRIRKRQKNARSKKIWIHWWGDHRNTEKINVSIREVLNCWRSVLEGNYVNQLNFCEKVVVWLVILRPFQPMWELYWQNWPSISCPVALKDSTRFLGYDYIIYINYDVSNPYLLKLLITWELSFKKDRCS